SFGPLGQAGGGRRLNVLVTRAREEVHLVTSIPPAAYRSLPPVPQGQQPGGAWLVFAYLHYAEQLAAAYERLAQASLDVKAEETRTGTPSVNVRPTRCPSPFAEGFARTLAASHGTGADVYWGNDGFGIDVALHHPADADDVTVGVLIDGCRFTGTGDPVEWDAFRTAIHESQGWSLHRLWTPHYFRDAEGRTKAVLDHAANVVAATPPRDGIAVGRRDHV
ncbi:MAG TPA: hypothetical protein VK324_16865, partial [Tepidisphaeraceae bacterium]|nr:hypothetical protein [Tepidisphaeraceae bacterium]